MRAAAIAGRKTLAKMKDKRINLAEKAYQVVENMIVTLELPPGTFFSEADLSRRVGIGRTPLREALQRLAAGHLVTTLPRRGMMVSEINIGGQLNLLDTRRVLDRLIAERAARRAGDEQREALRACAQNMQQAAAQGDIDAFMRCDGECDQILEAAARNPFATQAGAPLHSHCRRFWYFYRSNGDLNRAAELHIALMNAVADGNEQEAGQASERLLNYLQEFARAALDH